MVVRDFDVVAIPFSPDEANPPLVIDSDRVLPHPITVERLQSVSRRRSKLSQFGRGVQLEQLPKRDSLESPESPRVLVVKQFFGFLRCEALDHSSSIERLALYVKRRTSGVGAAIFQNKKGPEAFASGPSVTCKSS